MIRNIFRKWKEHALHWKGEIIFLIAMLKHPKIPTMAKIFVFILLSYIFSPFDVIPDFIPIFGHWDDLFMIPLTMRIVYRTTPEEIIREIREQTENGENPVFEGIAPKIAAITVLILWLVITWGTLKLLGI